MMSRQTLQHCCRLLFRDARPPASPPALRADGDSRESDSTRPQHHKRPRWRVSRLTTPTLEEEAPQIFPTRPWQRAQSPTTSLTSLHPWPQRAAASIGVQPHPSRIPKASSACGASHSSLSVPMCPWLAAACSTDFQSPATRTSAPAASNIRAHSSCPCAAARVNAVSPSLPCASTAAAASRRSLMTSSRPNPAAARSGEFCLPNGSSLSTDTRFSRPAATAGASPSHAARQMSKPGEAEERA